MTTGMLMVEGEAAVRGDIFHWTKSSNNKSDNKVQLEQLKPQSEYSGRNRNDCLSLVMTIAILIIVVIV